MSEPDRGSIAIEIVNKELHWMHKDVHSEIFTNTAQLQHNITTTWFLQCIMLKKQIKNNQGRSQNFREKGEGSLCTCIYENLNACKVKNFGRRGWLEAPPRTFTSRQDVTSRSDKVTWVSVETYSKLRRWLGSTSFVGATDFNIITTSQCECGFFFKKRAKRDLQYR